jgi:hypothetical protein
MKVARRNTEVESWRSVIWAGVMLVLCVLAYAAAFGLAERNFDESNVTRQDSAANHR